MSVSLRLLPLFPFILLGLMACSPEASNEQSQRIVSLGGEISETLVELGLEDQIVAVDTTSLYPERLQELPSVGYLRQLNIEGILALSPTTIYASADAGPDDILQRLSDLGVDVVRLTTGPSIDQALAAINDLGHHSDRHQVAVDLIEQNQQQIQAVQQLVENKPKPKVILVLAMNDGLPMVAGQGTKADTLIVAAGGSNAGQGFFGYKPMSTEGLLAIAPDVIVVASHGATQVEGPIYSHKSFRDTPAGINQRVFIVESSSLLSMGPRLGAAIGNLANLFYPAEEVVGAE